MECFLLLLYRADNKAYIMMVKFGRNLSNSVTTDLAVSYFDMQFEVIALEVCPFEAYMAYSAICLVAIILKSYINDFSFLSV